MEWWALGVQIANTSKAALFKLNIFTVNNCNC